MLGKLLVCAMLVAYASAGCNSMRKMKVKLQWAQAYDEGTSREAFGQAIWRALFSIDKDARGLFDRVNADDLLSPEFQAHSMRVLGGLDMCFSLLDDVETLKANLAHLKGQHIERGITSDNFASFGRALKQVVPATIGHCYDEEAWDACFSKVADGIKSL